MLKRKAQRGASLARDGEAGLVLRGELSGLSPTPAEEGHQAGPTCQRSVLRLPRRQSERRIRASHPSVASERTMEAITAEGRAEAAPGKGRTANGGVAERRHGPDRKSVVGGNGVSMRVELGGG